MTDERLAKAKETANRLFGRPMSVGLKGDDDGLGKLSVAQIYGEIWSRPGLDLKSRSLGVVAALVALDKPAEMRIHLQGALNVGWTRAELCELFFLLGYYAGFPAAIEALKLLEEAVETRASAPESR
ncbi:MAG: carboxymuconolactone decarboxylase family protein [Parvularculaceae bacterium]